MTRYVRYQSAVPNRHGTWPGVFALANGLLAASTLGDEDRRWLQSANARAQVVAVPFTHPGDWPFGARG